MAQVESEQSISQHITSADAEGCGNSTTEHSSAPTSKSKQRKIKEISMVLKRQKTKAVVVFLNCLTLLVGQSAGTILSRYYFAKGGKSRWLCTLLPSIGWPILVLPLIFSQRNHSSEKPSFSVKLLLIYVVLGVLCSADNLLYTWGVSFMPASTYSLLCSSQLAFNVLFSVFLNKQKLNFGILNSVVVLSVGAVILGIYSNGDRPPGVTHSQYVIGFFCTLGASALYSLLLCLNRLAFSRVIKRENFSVVLEMIIYTNVFATLVSSVGLFASGEMREVKMEAKTFTAGKVAYCMTLIWTAIGWQVACIGTIGLVFQVSSLFSGVVSTLGLPIIPILSVIVFHDQVTALKVISLFLCIWGFISYVHAGYTDLDSSSESQNKSEESDGSLA